MYSRLVSLPQSVLYDVLLLQTLRVYAPETPRAESLQFALAVVVTRPDQGVKQAGALDSAASSNGPDKPVVSKTWCNSGQIYPVLSEDFCAQKFVIKIHAFLYR